MIHVRFVREKLFVSLSVITLVIASLLFYEQRSLDAALRCVGALAMLVRPPQKTMPERLG